MPDKEKNSLLAQLKYLKTISNSAAENMPETVSTNSLEAEDLLRKALQNFEASLEEARIRANESGKVVRVDGSKLSGIKDGGDIWLVQPDGSYTREYKKIPEIEDVIEMRRSEKLADPDKQVNPGTIYEIIRLAQRAPNANNEQPNHVLIYPHNHSSMQKIGSVMLEILIDQYIPRISLRNLVLNLKKDNADFIPQYELKQLETMADQELSQFENYPAPLDDLPRAKNSMITRDRLLKKDGKFYKDRARNGQINRKDEYTLKDLLQDDHLFAQGMGRQLMKFKHSYPILLIILRKVKYRSQMTETLEKYGINIPDMGEAFLDAGVFTDHLALITRSFGLAGRINTVPLNIAADTIANIIINDLSLQTKNIKQFLTDNHNDKQLLEQEYRKVMNLKEGLEIGLEAYYAKQEHKKLNPTVKKQITMGKGFFPASFFHIGHPLAEPSELLMDPKRGRKPLMDIIVYMST